MSTHQHVLEYILLIIVFILGIIIFVTVPNFTLKTITALLISATYTLWGVWHHYNHGHLNFSIMAEYFLVSIIILLTLSALL